MSSNEKPCVVGAALCEGPDARAARSMLDQRSPCHGPANHLRTALGLSCEPGAHLWPALLPGAGIRNLAAGASDHCQQTHPAQSARQPLHPANGPPHGSVPPPPPKPRKCPIVLCFKDYMPPPGICQERIQTPPPQQGLIGGP